MEPTHTNNDEIFFFGERSSTTNSWCKCTHKNIEHNTMIKVKQPTSSVLSTHTLRRSHKDAHIIKQLLIVWKQCIVRWTKHVYYDDVYIYEFEVYAFLFLGDRQTLPQTRACVYFFPLSILRDITGNKRAVHVYAVYIWSWLCGFRCTRATGTNSNIRIHIHNTCFFLACLLCLLVRLLLAYKELENVA